MINITYVAGFSGYDLLYIVKKDYYADIFNFRQEEKELCYAPDIKHIIKNHKPITFYYV